MSFFRSVCVISLDSGWKSSLRSSANSFISDFILFGKSFMNIKSNKGPSTDLWGTWEGILLKNIIICHWWSSGANQRSVWNWHSFQLLFKIFLTCSADRQTDKTIWNHSSSRWTSLDKSGCKAIKFATLVLFKYNKEVSLFGSYGWSF